MVVRLVAAVGVAFNILHSKMHPVSSLRGTQPPVPVAHAPTIACALQRHCMRTFDFAPQSTLDSDERHMRTMRHRHRHRPAYTPMLARDRRPSVLVHGWCFAPSPA